MKRLILTFLLVVLAAVLGVAIASATGDANESTDNTADVVFLGDLDLAERLEIWRNQYRRMTPGDAPLVQDVGTWPAAWEEFSSVWDTAPAERDLATWLVPFSAERVGATTVIRDANGAALWNGATDFAKDESADVTLTGALVDELDWPLYTAVQEELAWRMTADRYREAAERQHLRDGEGGGEGGEDNGMKMFVSAVADFTNNPPEISFGLQWTNDVVLDIFVYGPLHTSSTHVVTYTNDENEVITYTNTTWHSVEPSLTGRFDNLWEHIGTVTLTNCEETLFVDTNYVQDRWVVRFYAAFEAGDTDNDGINDAFETRILGTSTNSTDSDNDGISEWDEYYVYRTNPNDSDTDHDSIDDLIEILGNTDPTNYDSDHDGVGDAEDPMPALSNMWWVVTASTNQAFDEFIDDRTSWPDHAMSYGNWTWTFSTERPWSNAIVRDVTITGFVDDVIKVDGHEVDWHCGTTNYDHFSITNQIADLQSGQFVLSLLDWPDEGHSGPNEVRIGHSDNDPFVAEWTWWIPFNVQMEPIWTTTGTTPLDNPSGIILGSNAWFRVNVWPDNLFPVTNIVWTSLCSRVQINPPGTGERVLVQGAEAGPDDLHVEVVGAQGGDTLPPFCVSVKPLTVVTAVVGVVQLVDGTNQVLASSSERVSDAIATANRLLLQACIQIEWDGAIQTIQGTTSNGYWNAVSQTEEITNLCSTLSCPGGLEIYFVNSIYFSLGQKYVAGLCPTNGILISSNAQIRTLSHEIGHVCGAKDIYNIRTDTTSNLQGNAKEAWMKKDWGAYRGNGNWTPTQFSIIPRLLMYGVSTPDKGDIPSGNVHGFRRRHLFGTWEWFEADVPCGLNAFTNTPRSW